MIEDRDFVIGLRTPGGREAIKKIIALLYGPPDQLPPTQIVAEEEQETETGETWDAKRLPIGA